MPSIGIYERYPRALSGPRCPVRNLCPFHPTPRGRRRTRRGRFRTSTSFVPESTVRGPAARRWRRSQSFLATSRRELASRFTLTIFSPISGVEHICEASRTNHLWRIRIRVPVIALGARYQVVRTGQERRTPLDPELAACPNLLTADATPG